MSRILFFAVVFAFLLPVCFAESPSTQPAAQTTTQPARKNLFTRFVRDENGNSMLETGEAVYRNADGVTVTLIGAVHIADPIYYDGLSASFDTYDALLYEMVKPKTAPGETVKTARRRGSLAWIGMFQKFMKESLDLSFQLEAIEYENRKNFVHADLDSEQFLQMQEERNEGFFQMFIRAMAAGGSESAQKASAELTPFHVLAALRSADRPRALKMLFARQLQNMEEHLEVLEGPKGSVILTERNKHAMNVLREEIAGGKKNLGVFYGAAHLPGMEKILVEDMGFHKVGQSWRTAWYMPAQMSPTTLPAN